MQAVATANFDFLRPHDPNLVRLGGLAERYFRDDPSTALIKLRQFAELLAKLIAARHGVYLGAGANRESGFRVPAADQRRAARRSTGVADRRIA